MLVPLVVALSLSAAGPVATKPTPKPKRGGVAWVALVQVRGDVPAAWSDALRAAAEQVKEERHWVSPPSVPIADAQLALGCSGWNDACAGTKAAWLV